jgi:transglutaminase-like putative cysteine protease
VFSPFHSFKDANLKQHWLAKSWPAIITVLLAGAGFLIFYRPPPPSAPPEPGYTIPRTVRYEFIVQNTTAQPLKNVRFWARAPIRQTATQRCEKLDASHPFQVESESPGDQVLTFVFDTLPPLAAKVINVTAALALSESPNRTTDKSVEEFLQPAPFIEADHPQIRDLAGQLKNQPKTDPGRKIYGWITRHVQNAPFRKNNTGALAALRQGAGDCTEQAFLFVALCRAAGIPARPVGGYLCDSDSVLSPNDYHNWAEFYHEGRWRIADPFYRVFDNGGGRYVAMRIVRPADAAPLAGMARFRISTPQAVARMEG